MLGRSNNVLIWILRFLRFFDIFPYRWQWIEKSNLGPSSFVSENRICNSIEFKKINMIVFFSGIKFFGLISFGIFNLYCNLIIFLTKNETYTKSFFIIDLVMKFCYFSMTYYAFSKFSKLKKIFMDVFILYNLNPKMKIISKENYFHFSLFIFCFILLVVTQISTLIIVSFDGIIFLTRMFYYWISTFNFFIVLTFFVICCFYSSVIGIFYLHLGKNYFLKEISNKIQCKSFLKILISKFRKMNKVQEMLNDYFGDIITRVLIFHIFYLILIPMSFSSSNDISNNTNLLFLMSFIWSFCVVYITCISPNIITKKVST